MTINPVLLENPQHPTYYIAQDRFGGIGSMFLHSTDGTWTRGGSNGTIIPATEVPHTIRQLAITVTHESQPSKSLVEGIAQSAAGDVVDLGSFAQYADDDVQVTR